MEEGGKFVLLAVSDTGVGIKARPRPPPPPPALLACARACSWRTGLLADGAVKRAAASGRAGARG